MAYRLKRGETVPEGIKRIVTEEIDSAVEQLTAHASSNKRDTAIHEARKSIKKIRGVLKLMRPELGKTYREQNGKLRDMGRRLSEFRDVGAIMDTFDSLIEMHKGKLEKNSLGSIRAGLEKNKREKEKTENVGRVMQKAASALRGSKRVVEDWPLTLDGFKALAPGLEETYRQGRKAMRAAQKQARPESYHEWRKRAKDHWYHIRLVESLWTEVMQAREQSLHDLETWLGDDHNLVVLCDQLSKDPQRYGSEDDIRFFLTLARERQEQLRDESVLLGKRIYEEKPGPFMQNMQKLWDAWQKEPEALKERDQEQRQPAKKKAGKAGTAKRPRNAA